MNFSLYDTNIHINEEAPSITPYLLEGESPFPVMIVCPGGAYMRRAAHEGEPVAMWLNEIGISAIVLNYRVAPFQHPAPLNDAQRAIRMTRHHSKEWNIDPNRVGILGFSAGGHVASSAGTHYEKENRTAQDEIDRYSCRPDLMVLCYPVITMEKYTHETSKLTLLSDQPDQSIIERMSNEKQITSDTPPTFLWHTADDASVSVENSLQFASSLSKYNIPYALHIFESGKHGLGLAEENLEAKNWTAICETWLRKRGF